MVYMCFLVSSVYGFEISVLLLAFDIYDKCTLSEVGHLI